MYYCAFCCRSTINCRLGFSFCSVQNNQNWEQNTASDSNDKFTIYKNVSYTYCEQLVCPTQNLTPPPLTP